MWSWPVGPKLSLVLFTRPVPPPVFLLWIIQHEARDCFFSGCKLESSCWRSGTRSIVVEIGFVIPTRIFQKDRPKYQVFLLRNHHFETEWNRFAGMDAFEHNSAINDRCSENCSIKEIWIVDSQLCWFVILKRWLYLDCEEWFQVVPRIVPMWYDLGITHSADPTRGILKVDSNNPMVMVEKSSWFG